MTHETKRSVSHGGSSPVSHVGLTQQASECDGGRQGSKVDEDDGSHALAVQGVLEVADILRVTSPNVSYQPAEGASCALQRVI